MMYIKKESKLSVFQKEERETEGERGEGGQAD